MAPRENKPSITFVNSLSAANPGWHSSTISSCGEQHVVVTSRQTAQRKEGTWPTTSDDQVQQAVDTLASTLKAGGASAKDIVKLTFYPVDWATEQADDLLSPILQLLIDKHGTRRHLLVTTVPVSKLSSPEAMFEIEAIALVAGASWPWEDTQDLHSPVPPVKVDVVVVGGGFSGLAAAYQCKEAGLDAVVLEAKSRIGGRSRSQQLNSGPGVVELGATWINKFTQPEVFALTQKFGLELAEQYTDGDEVFQRPDGTIIRSLQGSMGNGLTEEDREQEALLVGALMERPETLDIRKWSDFAPEEDITLAEWVSHLGCTGDYVQSIASHFCSAILGRGSDVVGAHYFLDYVKSGMGFLSLVTEGEMGAQSLKVKKGTSEIACSLGRALQPGSILLNTPVDTILQHGEDCQVNTSTGISFKARKVILANPTNTYSDIRFSPPLPVKKIALVSDTKPGYYAKVVASYREPWWRNAGLNGKFISLKGPICFSWDTSDLDDAQYSLAFFIAGDIANQWNQLPSLQQEAAVINHLAELVGTELADHAYNVLEINIVEWNKEEYIWGAPTSVMGPTMLSQYGEELRKPFLNLHFAGGETAYEWKGYLEGAITAGYRAAAEVVKVLQPEAKI
ncbi:hypothetical protein N7462_000467 [Penicillium macrosclerotiorum]|uniref:uncharacterized protein n=1 Tax=Penicillium macrosclerotiorum TaxID=303699 RepID=UPI00254780EB|nr:uncharacterized protein N7462_000467 [Penicillium macrosclerotiorum]KAJ5698462.1 hypothetical protein N7462_000467 [Penicillium macrosclerotiorum]